ncbi:MAG: prepilin-type N-terminal cleavage/methylation domain-containing protein, partial [Candidatus Omnitrophica bacterium]|nr:prepilin-type N-terminal cleavage/methylation domain-containing protein [Candidatus Omnitrophota bacterium]
MSPAYGFTLIEMLLGVAIFSLVAVFPDILLRRNHRQNPHF